MAKEKLSNQAEGRLVKAKDMVIVYGTGASKFMPEGKEYNVHRVQAESLVEKGHASYDDPTGGKKKKNKKEEGGENA